MNMTLSEIAAIVNGEVVGDGNLRVTGLNGIKEAQQGDITFFADPRYERYLEATPAAALIVPHDFESNGLPLVKVPEPYFAFAQLLLHEEQRLAPHPTGIHPTAVLAESATIGKNVALDAHAVVAAGATIGDNTVVYAGAYVGAETRIGPDCILYPNATLRERVTLGARCIVHANATIGADGFGFTRIGTTPFKIPQIGTVVIGDEVEIGANSAIDRSTTGTTAIGSRTKIDNLVQIAHNVSIGEDCTISGSCGISGSTVIGNNVTMGGQVGIGGHVTIGDNVMIAAKTGIHRDIPSNSVISGIPQNDHAANRKIWASLPYLPDLLKRVRKLEKQAANLDNNAHG